MKRTSLATLSFCTALAGWGQAQDSLHSTQQLDDVVVTSRRQSTLRLGGAQNGVSISRDELFRAACCNLGESFTTNPSVDVSYSDAATGARQIKLLGLSGTYVQMLTENLPNFCGAAAPFALSYVPGPWMKSIQVSKGAASVRNGYESITGQIDIEYLKPEDDEGATANVYADTKGRWEANADANMHLRGGLNGSLLAHYEDCRARHDDNHDGFVDQPDVRQWNLQSRWDYLGARYIFHGGAAMLREQRRGGQRTHHDATGGGMSDAMSSHPFLIDINTDRYEAYMKHAFVLDRDHGTNVALMASGALHQTDAAYGHKLYDATERNAYAQLMLEHHFTQRHELSAGLSANHDHNSSTATTAEELTTKLTDDETTLGTYAQYTLTMDRLLTLMAGLRADHSSRYGTFLTPRLHLKLQPVDLLTLRLSAGKGYRTPHALAENHNLLASGRRLVADSRLQQEEAWNYGVSAALTLPVAGRNLRLNAEYYYTDFLQQTIVDYESDPLLIRITSLDGQSYSHTMQVDATYPFSEQLTLTAAYRLNDVKTTYGHQLMRKPLTNRYKGLVTASYKTPLGLWQADVTLQLCGGGRLPGDMGRFHAYEQLSAQVTRWFRHFSVYVGGENLTGFRQKTPIIAADRPWSTDFEPTMVWGPVHGAMFYAGLRLNLGNRL